MIRLHKADYQFDKLTQSFHRDITKALMGELLWAVLLEWGVIDILEEVIVEVNSEKLIGEEKSLIEYQGKQL